MITFLCPRFLEYKNSLIVRSKNSLLQGFVLVFVGILFWVSLFGIFYRVLAYFQSIDVLGNFLAAKLLSMVLLTFFSILLFSTVITALSVFFLSEELQLIISSPYDSDALYGAKLLETIMNSSWMVLLFSLPVFFSYGIIFKQSIDYYLLLIAVMPPLIFICGAMGTGIALLLVKAFPARRLKDILFLLSLFVLVIVYLLFRFIRPERLVDPEVFITVIDYLSSLDMPAAPFIPSQWVTDCLSSMLFSRSCEDIGFKLGLLWSTAGALIVIANWMFNAFYFDAWSKSQEARTTSITRSNFFLRILEKFLAPFPVQMGAVIEKDIRCFFRDTSQWSQLFILGAIIIIYIYNFSVLPIDKSPFPTKYFQNAVSFLNLGLAGFVLAAIAVRFGFPAISTEGEAFWLIKTSPLTLKRFIQCKFLLIFIMLVLLGQFLILCTNFLLQVDWYMIVLSCGTIVCMTLGITGLCIGFGAAFPKFKYENIAQIPTGFGGLLYMMIALSYITFIVIIEALPVHHILTAQMIQRPLTMIETVITMIAFAMVIVTSATAMIVPIKIGIKRLEEHETI